MILCEIKPEFVEASQGDFPMWVWIFINTVVLTVNVIVSFYLKKQDKTNLTHQITEQQRIRVYEDLYKSMCIINQRAMYADDREIVLKSIDNLNKDKAFKQLHITKRTTRIITDFCDYYKTIIEYLWKQNRDVALD